MRTYIGKGWYILLLVGILWACKKQEVPLDKDQFRSLLIDLHRVDGTLAVNRSMGGYDELKNYAYYNDIFKKYGITRADFDSCMYYYSAQTVMFSKMYDVIIDTLNRQLTGVDKVLNELKAKDSVNYFPLTDTLCLDSILSVTVDSIVPGLYKFSTTVRFDTLSKDRRRRIASFFLSEDGKDTLRVRDVTVNYDTLQRSYNWSQYVDSVYSRLVITFMDTLPPVKPWPKVKGRPVQPVKKEKEADLKQLGGEAWGTYLFRPYISRETERRLKNTIRR